jgi:hypothetical protein
MDRFIYLTQLAGSEIWYLSQLPTAIPRGKVLVHNQGQPTRRLGSRGFRAWLSGPDRKTLEVCDCGWAPELGRHFRVARIWAEEAGLLSAREKAATRGREKEKAAAPRTTLKPASSRRRRKGALARSH